MLHAEGEAALQFADGYSVYACHGRHPSQEERYSRISHKFEMQKGRGAEGQRGKNKAH
ncbi:hypothetical protein [uncultured Nostoc sp.]|uniref:hypothetical protein n=1 Tax=uncultured Nostoc sp. TaxID=340711 RepID=UPI0035CB14FA